ncbi:hypothetical protein BKA70DRAFT_1272661 [Coprinopsis sp. MPI-PUGE-AT-0042]|nr:hypothetical protein BKA70DRAFT_1272661 [Coprinopsis sp. MPI-PUGE-AT-0042]
MPRTRNVSRSQWAAATAGSDPKPTKENGYGSEKENTSRAPPQRGRGLLDGRCLEQSLKYPPKGRVVIQGEKQGETTGEANVDQGGKAASARYHSRFLPAPESENRGHAQPTGFGPPENLVLSPTTAGPSVVLPSGPGRYACSQSYHRELFDERREAPAVSDAWKEFDFAVPDSDARQSRPRATPRNSDPFGFFALERKLEAEREEEAVGAIVLVKDTSPGLEYTDDHAEGTASLPSICPHYHPPHKRGVIPRRESFTSNADHLFSTPASSCPSSPSPTKPQAPSSKRKAADFDAIHDEPAGSTPHVPRQPKRVEVVEEQEAKPVLRRSQRGHKKPVEEEDAAEPQPGPSRKLCSTKPLTTTKRTRSKVKKETTTKSKKSAPAILPEDDSDAEEKRELERQARLAYFRELDEYKVETENVYVI